MVQKTVPSPNTIFTSKEKLKLKAKEVKEEIKHEIKHEALGNYTIGLGTKAPIVAIVNKKSGGQMGAKVLSSFYNHLNPIQVA